MRLKENKVKRVLQAGGKTFGGWCALNSSMAAEMMAHAGFDWLIIDNEHSIIDLSTTFHMLQAVDATDTLPFVRVPWNDVVYIKKILDAGAYGILVPYVNSVEECENAVSYAKYPTRGIRGVAGPRATGYGRYSADYYQRANDELIVMCQVETAQAVDACADMCDVDGLDLIFVGPADLSASMGHLGDLGHPEVRKAIRHVIDTCRAKGKAVGTVSTSVAQARERFEDGFNLVSVSNDTGYLRAASDLAVKEMRAYFEK